MMADTDTLRKEKKELEERIRVIENWRWHVLGVTAGVSAAVTLLMGMLSKLLAK
jgi:hypothetical protein